MCTGQKGSAIDPSIKYSAELRSLEQTPMLVYSTSLYFPGNSVDVNENRT